MSRHPGDEKLAAWLESGRPRRVGRHVEECDVCLERLESASDLDGGLLTELATAASPPADHQVRTTSRVQERLAAEEAFAAMLDLFSVPWKTAVALLETDPVTSPLRGTDRRDRRHDHQHDDRPDDDRPDGHRSTRPEAANPEEHSDG